MILFFLPGFCNPAIAKSGSLLFHPKYGEEVKSVIALSGENKAELETFLSFYPTDSQMFEAASFLTANLPLADAVSITAEELREHVDYAFLARRLMPWGKEIPWDIFLHYVVPHRISQEPLQQWRKRLFPELKPRLRKCRTIEEAALEINKWCFLKAAFESSAPYDQGPLTTILRGKGRCEELVILFIAAARSAGIPARECFTPAWQNAEGNHAWVEIWTPRGWRYLGAGEPDTGPDRAWFSHRTPWIALALATAYGVVESDNETLYKRDKNFTLINSTSAYTIPFPLEVSVLGPHGAPLSKADVFVSLYNSGILRPIARIPCDEHGKGVIELGQSTVLLTVAKQGKTDYEFVRIRPDSPHRTTLDLRRNRLPSGSFSFTFGKREKPRTDDNKTSSASQQENSLASEKKRLQSAREAEFDLYKRAVADYLNIAGKDAEIRKKPLADALISAGGNCFELMRALSVVPDEQAQTLEKYILTLSAKDRVGINAVSLLADVEAALEARKKIRSLGILSYGDDLFSDFVLNNRIYYEARSDWRPFLRKRFASFLRGDLKSVVRRVNHYVQKLNKIEKGILEPLMSPDAVVRTGTVTTEMERGIVGVALLRALGIPARYLDDWNWVEYYTGRDWLPFYPNAPEQLGNRNVSELTRNVYGKPAEIRITFKINGQLCSQKEMDYRRDFTLSRFDEEGFFRFLTPKITFDEEESSYRTSVPAGKYFLIAGRRNGLGEPRVRIIPFTCKPGEKKSFHVELTS